MADFRLRITLTAADGAVGLQASYTGPGSAPMAWNRETDAPTTGAVIELIDAHGEVVDDLDLDGDEWRVFEEGDGLAKVFRWMNCPKFYGGLGRCILAVQMGIQPDGWTDAHDELLRLQEERAAVLDDGGPAYPLVETTMAGHEGNYHHDVHSVGGMSLRDRMALGAMQAVPMQQNHLHDIESSYDRIATHAYRMADAMLRARRKGGGRG